eukprot:CCRYP_003125-RA/>CCRYP_003125-RA protein AED:0.38 eAED:0.50 QI:0/0/0/1/0/0/3/0/89
MSALMVALEFVRAYLDDLLCIKKANLEDDHDKLKMQINTRKLFFCAIETDYLGYTLTRTGIKPQQKKLQLKNVKNLRRFLGMFQHYRYL